MTLLLSVLFLALFYLVLICPGLRKKPFEEELMGWMYAHRGLHDNNSDAPENSMRAFERAVNAGFGIELDIQLSKDRVPVVFHDFTLERICQVPGKVEDYTFRELQQFSLCGTDQRIPKFEDVLAMVNGQVPLIVEFKIEAMKLSLCPLGDRLLRNYSGKYMIESFNPLGVRWFRKHHPEVIRGQLSDGFLREDDDFKGILAFALQNLLFNVATKPDFVAYNCKYPRGLSRLLCRNLFGNRAVAWTVRSEEQLAKARKYFDLFIFESFRPEGYICPGKSGAK